MFLAKDHAAFDADRTKLAVWADIGQNLLWGFVQGRDDKKLRQHGDLQRSGCHNNTWESTPFRGLCCANGLRNGFGR